MFLLVWMPELSRIDFGFLPADLRGAQVHQHQVVVCAAAHQAESLMLQSSRQGLGIIDDLLAVNLEFRPERLAESSRFGGNHVHQRAALGAREDGAVDALRQVLRAQDQAAAWPRKVLCVVDVTTSQ